VGEDRKESRSLASSTANKRLGSFRAEAFCFYIFISQHFQAASLATIESSIVSTSSEQLPAQPAPRPWPLAPEPEPVFGMFIVLLTFVTAVLASLFCLLISMSIARHLPSFRLLRPIDLAMNPRVVLPAQLAGYVMVLAALWFFFVHYFHLGFLNALSWRWPARWHAFLIGGVLLAIVVQVVSHFLPTPPEMPIDKMLQTPLDAWMMTIFGAIIAPFVEEVFFRGLFFPALTRYIGVFLSMIVTSVFFGLIHAGQLAGAWIEVSVIVIVGTVLTLVRWRFRSLASSTLVHIGYNASLFGALFVQTRGFTSFPIH
jgi:hypothetical protein